MNRKLVDKPVDRRSVRTRNALSDALIELLAERGWDNIAVQDVCERANIGRSTFYSHYSNKDALLQGGLNALQTELQHQARARADNPTSGAGRTEGFGFAPGLIEQRAGTACGLPQSDRSAQRLCGSAAVPRDGDPSRHQRTARFERQLPAPGRGPLSGGRVRGTAELVGRTTHADAVDGTGSVVQRAGTTSAGAALAPTLSCRSVPGLQGVARRKKALP